MIGAYSSSYSLTFLMYVSSKSLIGSYSGVSGLNFSLTSWNNLEPLIVFLILFKSFL